MVIMACARRQRRNSIITQGHATYQWQWLELFGSVARFNDVPVDDLPDGSQMVGTAVLIVEIVGMFPHVDAHERLEVMTNGVAAVHFLRDDKLTVFVGGEPHPTRTEECSTLLLEFLLEGIKRTKLRVDGSSECANGLAVGLRRSKLCEVEVVVEELTSIVEDATFGSFYNLLERLSFETTSREEVVEVGHVGVEVLAVVNLDGLCTNDRFEGRHFVRKSDEFELAVGGLCAGQSTSCVEAEGDIGE